MGLFAGGAVMDLAGVLQILDSTIRLSTPLLFACLAGLFSERAGVFDIGLEGKMLAGAFLAASVSFATGSVWWGLLAGIGASLLFAAVHGLAAITFRGNQLISGVALNFLASGLTVVLGASWFGLGGQTPALAGGMRFSAIDLPFALAHTPENQPALKALSLLPGLYSQVLSGHSILVYVAVLCVPLTWWVLYRTRFGLRLRAVGENPAAVDTAGVSVVGLRFAAVAITGVLCGLSGAYLSMGLSGGFLREMTEGRGYIALAALIFAKWRPWSALLACVLFGLLDAIAIRYQSIDLGWMVIPVQFTQALPYILTVIILAGFVGKAIPPRAGGEPYVKER
jgi:simple sugar transport system permease protein